MFIGVGDGTMEIAMAMNNGNGVGKGRASPTLPFILARHRQHCTGVPRPPPSPGQVPGGLTLYQHTESENSYWL